MVRAEMFCRPLPVVFVAIGVENRFSRNVVLAEYFSDIVLVFGRKEAFFPIETVVFPPSEVSNQQAFQGVKALVGYVVEQVADSPRNMYLLCRQEVGALVVVFGDAQRVDDMDGGYSAVSRSAARRRRQLSVLGHWALKQREKL